MRALTDTLPAPCPELQLSPWGKGGFFPSALPPGYDICHQVPMPCCHVPSLCTCSPVKGPRPGQWCVLHPSLPSSRPRAPLL